MNIFGSGEQGKDTLREGPDPSKVLLGAPVAAGAVAPTDDDLSRLHQFCWMVVREPLHAAMTFRLAHSVLEAICRWQPANGSYLNALALSQYRIGEYRATLETLAKAEAFMPGTPVSLAFQAMARFQLGDKDGSLALFQRLQEIMHLPPWHQDAEATGFFREARSLIPAKVHAAG